MIIACVAAVSVSLVAPAVSSAAGFSCSNAGAATYAVAAGDSWFAVASRAEVSTAALLGANGASENDALHPGDVLCLPDGANASAACSSRGVSTYTVESGDGWFGIAQRTGVSATALFAANGASQERSLHPGEVICLPSGSPPPASTSGSGGQAAASAGATYIVVEGDSWFGIATRAGVTTRALLNANDADADRVLLPGIAITLPSGAAQPSGSSSSSSSGSSGSSGSYTVGSGDSWFSIAADVGVTARSLLNANDADADDLLLPGERLTLPSGADLVAAQRAARSNGVVSLQAMPTQGPCGYADTWLARRSGGRRHLGVDVFGKQGDYVYAVVDGRLTSRAWDQPGRIAGNAWTLTSANGSGTFFFYAHLLDFAPGLRVGSTVKAGQIIGFMGTTGNASATHLHFEIHPNGGSAVNPYSVVRAGGGCNTGTPYTQPGGWVPD